MAKRAQNVASDRAVSTGRTQTARGGSTIYEVHGQLRNSWGPWYWTKLSSHKSREEALKSATKQSSGYRKMRIHKIEIEPLPKWFTHDKS